MKKPLLILLLSFLYISSFAQIGVGGGASWVVPMNKTLRFYNASQGFKVFFTPDVSDDEITWNFGFAYAKFTPKQDVFEAYTPNGVLGDVRYTDYTTVPVFAGLDFRITEKPIGLYAGAYIGGNFIKYTVDSEDWAQGYNRHTNDNSGLNAFFSPRIGATVFDSEVIAIGLEAQYFATMNKKAGWIEDYVTFSLTFMIKTSSYM